jgi:hypothetical protein
MVENSDSVTDVDITMIAKLTMVTKSSLENVFLRDHRGLRDHRDVDVRDEREEPLLMDPRPL